MNKKLINKNYNYWIQNSPNDIKKKLLKFSDEEKYQNFNNKVNFGTAGVRSIMGYGSNKINEFIISQYAYSFGRTLLKLMPFETKKYGVVIFHDNRKNGIFYSFEAAKTLSALGIPVYLPKNNELNPTPFLSYIISNNNFVGGLNITASHNPKEYNGFKIYDQTGKQASTIIIKYIEKNLPKNIFTILKNEINIFKLDESFEKKYIQEIINRVPLVKNKNRKDLKVTFSSNHGTSLKFGIKILNELNVNYEIVKEQSFPSETFENVKYPNPQDKRTFDISKIYALKNNSDIIFVTDPDADRFGVMAKHNNKYVCLNGNEISAIQIYYKLNKLSEKKNYDFSNKFIIRSIVTSRLADSIAKEKNVKVYETITGFKSIFLKIEKMMKKNEEPLFAWEESNGSTIELITKDKDSFQSLYQILEIVYEYKQQNKTLVDLINEIYNKYGYYLMTQKQINYDLIDGIKEMNCLIDKYRNLKRGNVLFDKKIIKIIDYKKGYKNFKKQNILFIYFENDSYICFRPSGTEPLLRIYFDLKGDTKQNLKKWYEKIIKEIEK